AEVADDRYWRAVPAGLLPAGGPVWLLHGMADDQVPSLMSLDYARWARAAGARAAAATCVLLPGAGHFEVIDPLSREWPQVVDAFRRVGGSSERGEPATRTLSGRNRDRVCSRSAQALWEHAAARCAGRAGRRPPCPLSSVGRASPW